MLRNKLHYILLLSFTGGLLLPGSVNAERVYGQIEPPRFKIGRFALKYEMDRFDAKSNYTANGGVDAKLPGSFEAYNAYLGVENDLSAKWSLSGGILTGLSRSSKDGASRRNTDVKGLQFGVNRNYKLAAFSKLSLIADFKYFQALHNNKFGSEEVSLGDGTSWIQMGSWVGTDAFKHARVWFYGGVNWPFKGLSKNFVFLIRPEFKLRGGSPRCWD